MTPDAPIERLRLRVRSLNGLRRAEIRTVSQLCEWTPRRLLKIQHFGRRSLADVRTALAEHGLCLAADEPIPCGCVVDE